MLELKRYILTELKSERITKLEAASAIKQLDSEVSAVDKSLLQRRVSIGSDTVYLSELSGDEHFLSDHQVLGNKILPGVAYVEMAVSALRDNMSRDGANIERITLRNIVFSQPCVVNSSKAVAIALSSKNERGEIHFSVSSHAHSELCIHAQGMIKSGEKLTEEILNLNALHSKNKALVPIEKFYSIFEGMGIEYGPAHKTVSDISTGSDGVFEKSVIANLALPVGMAQNDEKAFYLHPSILDGALQASIALDVERFSAENHPTVPFRVDKIEVFSGVPLGNSLVVANRNTDVDNNVNDVFDFFVCHPDGKVYLKMSGFHARPYGKLGSELARSAVSPLEPNDSDRSGDLVGELTLTPSWDVVDISDDKNVTISDPSHTAIVIGGSTDQQDALRKQFTQIACVGSDSLTTTDEITAALSSCDIASHIVWFVPDSESDKHFSSVIKNQHHGVIFGLKLVKSLLALSYDAEPLSLIVVTQKSVATYPNDLINPSHGSVHGFIGSLAKEYEHWRIRQIDLSNDLCGPLQDIQNIPEGQTEYAHRHGQWFKKTLLLTSFETSETSAYVTGGTYILFGGAGGLGVLLSEYLVKNYNAKIIWVGRRKENDEINALRVQVEQYGPRPSYVSVDTMNAEAVRRFRDSVYNDYSHINGIIFTALVLNDGALLKMDEEKFSSSLAAKVDLSVNVTQAFSSDNLDFMLFFSSLQSEFRAVGQSNYAAGSTFVDSFSSALRQHVAFPVKVVNWGYWGSTGIVASDFYRARMASLGINEIRPERGMALVENILSSALDQVGYIETSKSGVALSIGVSLQNHAYGLGMNGAEPFNYSDTHSLPMSVGVYSQKTSELNTLIDELLLFQLLESKFVGVDAAVLDVASIDGYLDAWLHKSICNLSDAGFIVRSGGEYRVSEETLNCISDVWPRWSAFRESVKASPSVYHGFANKVQLVELTLKALPSILRGETPATAAMFPGGSLSLVEGLYKNNLISDHFNQILAEQLLSAVKQKFERDNQPVRILEIGAGSGGTSEKIFEALSSIPDAVCQYTFTDVSKVFLNHAKENYSDDIACLETRLFDVSVSAQDQSLPLGGYDFVVATNVLHACVDIRSALRNCKSLLAHSGVAFINEAICSDAYLHCTFGLLEGWWLFKDREVRIPGSPIIDVERWKLLLASEGFRNIKAPCSNSKVFQQQVFIADSDGIVRQSSGVSDASINTDAESRPAVPLEPMNTSAVRRDLFASDRDSFKLRLSDSIASVISDVVAIDRREIQYDAPLSQVGVDSILVVKITNALRKTFSSIDSTLLFDCNSIDSLSSYFIENNLDSVKQLLVEEDGCDEMLIPNGHELPVSNAPINNDVAADDIVSDNALYETLVGLIRKVMANVLHVEYEDVGPAQAFEALGIDSILTVQISNAIKQKIGNFESTLLFDYRNIESLASFLVNEAGVREKLTHLYEPSTTKTAGDAVLLSPQNGAELITPSENRACFVPKKRRDGDVSETIAIVGLSGRYAKSNNVDEFWENLQQGRNCIDEVPALRWDWSEYLHVSRDGSGKIYTKWGGFIEDADHFDPLFFSISPREAESMDPQERAFLQCAYSTIEDAGYTPNQLSESKTGVFAGVMNNTYQRQPSHWSVANRVSYCFDFDGPSFSIDTACSSSLTAIHLACNSLRLGECEQAIAGGVNIIESPAHYEGLTEMNMLSESNQCRSFGDEADGFVDGEGVGAVLLKPLNKAIQDGDQIYGVIRGSAINHGGRTNGYTVPSPSAQAKVISSAFESAGVTASEISYVEAHGTGTELGDPIEFSGLSRALGKDTNEKQFCALGSVKSNIGHCESAAGIAGLTKVLLQMKYKQLVPSLHSSVSNTNIDFSNSPFVIQNELSDWNPVDEQNEKIPRIAGMSSFGAGGANAHVIVEEYETSRSSIHSGGKSIVVLSAKTEGALARRVSDLVTSLEKNTQDLTSIAYTLQTGREHFPHRVAFVASSVTELLAKLRDLQSHNKGVKVFSSVLSGKNGSSVNAMDSDDQSYIVERCISKGQYDKLAKLWCEGFDISWSMLYPAPPHKVNLPTYPFEKESYWEPVKGINGGKYLSGPSSPKIEADSFPRMYSNEEIITRRDSGLVGDGELLYFNERLIKKALGSPEVSKALAVKDADTKLDQTVVFVPDLNALSDIKTALSGIGGRILFVDQSYENIEDKLVALNIDSVKPLRVIYLWLAECADYIEAVTSLLTITQTLKAKGFSRVDFVLYGQSTCAVERAYIESWSAFGKSLTFLSPGYRMSVIVASLTSDIERKKHNVDDWGKRLSVELTESSDHLVIYSDGERFVYDLEEQETDPLSQTENSDLGFKAGGTYLITGGLGGTGEVFARFAAQYYQANLILCGRSSLDSHRKETIETLVGLGAQVHYFSADVSNRDEMKSGIDEACNKFGVIDGVLHIAGVDDERTVFDKTPAQFSNVLRPKVEGALVLDELLSDQPLDFVAYFSSVSALLGDLGACDYAMANRFMWSYAEHRETLRESGEVQGKSYVVAWPLLQDGGMQSADDDETRLYLQTSGQQALSAAASTDAFCSMLDRGKTKTAVFYGDRTRILGFLGLAEASESSLNSALPVQATQRIELRGLSLRESVIWDIKEHINHTIKVDRSRLDINENLSDFGFDSITLATFAASLSRHFKFEVTPALFFNHSTIDTLASYFENTYADVLTSLYEESDLSASDFVCSEPKTGGEVNSPKINVSSTNMRPDNHSGERPKANHSGEYLDEAVAVIGMSGRFPDARNVDELWSILSAGKNAVTEIPSERFNWQDYIGDPIKQAGKTNGKWLGALPGVDEFDPKFFEISPADAETMDPRQRLLLQEAWRAVEDAGLGKAHLSQQTVGMFVGVEQGDYQDLMDESPLTANHDGILAARLAYMLNLSGPALAINTACSSGLVAAHEACLSLRSGECDMAIAAGVNVLLRPDAFIAMGKAGMLSSDGKCHAFSEDANGMVPGEAVVAVVLKKLRDAERDGDPIYGVVRGSGINYDGKTNGITAPSGKAQATLLSDVYKRHNIDPSAIEYIVTHGTGTRLGDPVEINALYETFESLGVSKNHLCALTSAKSNLGHTFAASGLVNLVCLLLSMRHKIIPASLHCEVESNYIPWADSPFYVNKQNRDWGVDGKTCMGAVSAFGMSGTNAHMVVESYGVEGGAGHAQITGPGTSPYYLLAISAKNKNSLEEQAQNLIRCLSDKREAPVSLENISLTLLEGRHHFAHRAAIVVRDKDEAVLALSQVSAKEKIPNVHIGEVDRQFIPQDGLLRYGNDQLNAISNGMASHLYGESVNALAELFCQGYALPWHTMFSNKSLRRVHLPTYPFLRGRYWVDSALAKHEPALGEHNYRDKIHPLIHRNISTLREQLFNTSFNGCEFFLSDHVVLGEKILPGVAYLEMVLVSAYQALGTKDHISIENVTFQKPLIVDDSAVSVNTALIPETDNTIRFDVSSISSNGAFELHATGKICVGTQSSEVKKHDLNHLLQSDCETISSDRVYETFSHLGLSYGSAFRGVDEITVCNASDATVLVSKLVTGSVKLEGGNGFTLPPGVMDSALQSCIGFILRGGAASPNSAAIPFSIEKVSTFGEINQTEALYAVSQARINDGKQLKKFDVDIVDMHGVVLVAIEGFCSREIPADSSALTMDSSETSEGRAEMLIPEWALSPIESEGKRAAAYDHTIVVIGNDAEALKSMLGAAHIVSICGVSDDVGENYTEVALRLLSCLRDITLVNGHEHFVQLLIPLRDEGLYQGLSAMMKSYSLEHRNVYTQTLQIDAFFDKVNLAKCLVDEIEAGMQDADVSLANEGRKTLRYGVMPLSEKNEHIWRDDGVYLITGGMGGLGQLFVEDILASVENATIVLLGRRAKDLHIENTLSKLQRAGNNIDYCAVDVGDENALTRTVEHLCDRYGTVTSVIHAAGLSLDKVIRNKSDDELVEVFRAKVKGLLALDRATKNLPLDMFVTFSSLSAVHGNVGQADYAAANAFMDAFAFSRQEITRLGQRSGRTLSLNWPLWINGGMQVDSATLQYLKRSSGMTPLSARIGLDIFKQALSLEAAQIIVHSYGEEVQVSISADQLGHKENDMTNEEYTRSPEHLSENELAGKVQSSLVRHISDQLKVDAGEIDVRAEFSEFGFDSVSLTVFSNTLNEAYAVELSPTVFFEFPTVDVLSEFLVETFPVEMMALFSLTGKATSRPKNTAPGKSSSNEKAPLTSIFRLREPKTNANTNTEKKSIDVEPVAIVGISGNFPDAPDLDQFWSNLSEGKDCISEVPGERWDWDDLYGDPDNEYNKTNVKHAGVIEGIELFDPLFFGISPREAEAMDPQQRLLMTYVWKAIEDSGHAPESLNGSNTGMFIATGSSGYATLMSKAGSEIQGFSAAGMASSVGPNRMSYLLNLHGPSEPIETACSSALVAVHRAVRSIRSGDCDQAVVGGVNLLVSPDPHISFDKAGMLAKDGRCKTFSKNANGYVRGEGVGMMLLKPLSKAEMDGDNIYGLIRGTAENHGGRSNSLTAPNPRAQAEVIKSALRQSDIDLRSVSYIEAHGTGTALGDPIEVEGLKKAFSELALEQGTELPQGYCGLGSVKTNIGHLELAAGMASMMKVLLQMKHKTLVPSLHCDELNPYIDIKESPFGVVTKAREWDVPRDEEERPLPRRAGISSFGFGGVNAHVILEEYISKPFGMDSSENPVMIVLSAKTNDRLVAQKAQLAKYLETNNALVLNDLAFTLQVGRDAMDIRWACIVSSVDELICALSCSGEDQIASPHIFSDDVKQHKRLASLVAGDEDFHLTLRSWLLKEKYDTLCELWVSGMSWDWSALYSTRPKRLSLPTYPFVEQRCWFSLKPDSNVDTNKMPVEIKASLTKQVVQVPPSETPELLLYREECVQHGISKDIEKKKVNDTLIVVLSNIESKFQVDEIYSRIYKHVHYLVLDALLSNDSCLDMYGCGSESEVTVVYLCPLENAEFIEDLFPLWTLLRSLKKLACKAMHLQLCGFSSHAIELARLESWMSLNRSLQAVFPAIISNVFVEDCGYASSSCVADLTAWATRTVRERLYGNSTSAVYRGSERFVFELKSQAFDKSSTDATNQAEFSAIKPGGTYLITGGVGGVALVLAEYLVSQYDARLVLCGRSELNEAIQRKIHSLTSSGGEAYYFSADIMDETRMKAGLTSAYERFGVIDGVFHAAGIGPGDAIFEQAFSDFASVISPKVQGAIMLDRLLVEQPLDFVCYISSISATLGDLGSCEYALANRFLLSYAETREVRRDRGEVQGRSLAIAWPMWASGGMQSAAREQTDMYLSSSGQVALDNDDALKALEYALRLGSSKYFVVKGIPSRVNQFVGLATEKHAVFDEYSLDENVVTKLGGSNTPRPELKGFSLSESILWDLKNIASGLLKIDASYLSDNENLADFGFDSITLAMFAKSLSAHFSIEITPSVFFSYPTLMSLCKYFADKHAKVLKLFYASSSVSERDSAKITSPPIAKVREIIPPTVKRAGHPAPIDKEAVAVIGMSGRFPGARNVEELWSLLSEGRSAVEEIPTERFDWREYFGDPVKEPGKTNGKWLGAIPGVGEFDPKFFEISPAEAEKMDPRQRLLLQESWRALEDAGYGEAQIAQQSVGMFVGVEQGDYQSLLDESPLTANHDGILAARLAYSLDLKGPALAINTACSSGLVAAHEACLSLRAGDCDTAIAAGVNILLRPEGFVAMGQAGMLSPSGKCSAFSENANGMVPGEAVVAVVLKRLSDAERDGDPIYGVIRGSGINYDGKTNGITAPSGKAQSALLRDVYEKHQVSPSDIEYVVTHGTGTRLGDPVEINALYDVFKPTQKSETPHCALTSTKSNLGHTFAASGLVSFVSLLLSMRHETIPSSLHCDIESDYIPWTNSPFYVNKQPKAWPKKDRPRIGALSAFGMSGTNAHMVLESYDECSTDPLLSDDRQYYMLPISAKSESALKERVAELRSFLQAINKQSTELLAISYTLFCGRHHFRYRTAIVVQDTEDAIHTLGLLADDERSPKVFNGEVDRDFVAQTGLLNFGETQLLGFSRLDECMDEKEALYALSDLYCQGYDLAWKNMFGDKLISRVNLPAYPFEREHYWANPSSASRMDNSLSLNGDSDAVLFGPLNQKNTSILDLTRFSATFTGEEFFIRDHVVNRNKVLPGVVFLEMVRAAAEQAMIEADHNRICEIANIVLLSPLSFDDKPIDVHVTLSKINERCAAFSVYSELYGEKNNHAQGRINFPDISALDGGGDSKSSIDIADYKVNCERRVEEADCYNRYADMGLMYGPACRGVKAVHVMARRDEDRFLVSDIELPEFIGRESISGFALHPTILDAALQSSIGFMFDDAGFSGFINSEGKTKKTMVPFGFEKVTLFDSLSEEKYVTALLTSGSDINDPIQKIDVDLINNTGKLCVRIQGFSVRNAVVEADSASDYEAHSTVNEERFSAEESFETRSGDRSLISTKIEKTLVGFISEQLKVKHADIDVRAEFSEFGFDSVSLTVFSNTLNQEFGLDLLPTSFFEYPTIRKLSSFLIEAHEVSMIEIFAPKKVPNDKNVSLSEEACGEANDMSALNDLLGKLSRKVISVDDAINEMVG